MSILTSAELVEALVSTIGGKATDQQKTWLHQALTNLVAHAKKEQLLQMKLDVKKSIGSSIIKK